jgi:hypothetical protein
MRATIGSFAAAAAVIGTATASAADLHVPSQYPTIQAAIDASMNGDTIRLAAGEFIESAVISGKSVAVRGAGIDSTIWRCPSGARCLHVPTPQPSISIEVSDLSVTGFGLPYNAAAIDIESGGPNRVSRVRFYDNGGWASLECFGGGSIVEDCIFERCSLGLSLAHSQGSRIERCEFLNNLGAAESDLSFFEVNAVVKNCLIWGSVAGTAPIHNWATVRIESTSFVDLAGGLASVSEGVPGTGTHFQDCRFCACPEPRFAQTFFDLGGNVFESVCNDCDSDGVPDAVEISRGALDLDRNGVPDVCEVDPCPADITGNGSVNGLDLAAVLSAWGTNGQGEFSADIDNDGIVSGTDLAFVLGGWGPCQ